MPHEINLKRHYNVFDIVRGETLEEFMVQANKLVPLGYTPVGSIGQRKIPFDENNAVEFFQGFICSRETQNILEALTDLINQDLEDEDDDNYDPGD